MPIYSAGEYTLTFLVEPNKICLNNVPQKRNSSIDVLWNRMDLDLLYEPKTNDRCESVKQEVNVIKVNNRKSDDDPY